MRAGISRAYIWTTDQVAAAAIESEDIADAAVTAAKLASAAVETAKIKDAAVTNAKIADLAVTEAKIGSKAVTNSKLADYAVTGTKIDSYSITESKINNYAVTTPKLADYAVTALKLYGSAVETDKIKDLAVTNAKIADLAVTGNKIAGGNVNPSHLSGAITASRAKAYRSTTQSYNANTHTKVEFDTEVFDPLDHYDNTTNFRYTVASGYYGQYVVHAHVTFPDTTSDCQPWLEIYVNGSEVQISYLHQIAGNGILTGEIMGVLNLIAGDYVEIYIHSSAAGQIQGGSDKTYFEIFRLP